jgi:hypothetical protein
MLVYYAEYRVCLDPCIICHNLTLVMPHFVKCLDIDYAYLS